MHKLIWLPLLFTDTDEENETAKMTADIHYNRQQTYIISKVKVTKVIYKIFQIYHQQH